MWTDPIIDEIHHIRQEYAARFNFDMDAIVQDLQQQQTASKHRVVSFIGQTPPSDIAEAWTEESERRFARYQENQQSMTASTFIAEMAAELGN